MYDLEEIHERYKALLIALMLMKPGSLHASIAGAELTRLAGAMASKGIYL